MRKLLCIAILSLSVASAYAHEGHDDNYELRLLKTIELKDKQVVYLTVRDQGHVLGQPFIVETRVSCQGPVTEVSKLPVHDSYSVCDMQPESIKLNKQRTAVAMKSKSADINSYYSDIEKGVQRTEVRCRPKTEILKFTLQNLCK
jgi:hypothetical protein